METSEVLNKAADLIEVRGWARGLGSMDVGNEGMCLEAAVSAAADNVIPMVFGGPQYAYFETRQCPASRAVVAYLDLNGTPAYRWNDAPGRTAAQVIGVLRACALIEAAREEQDAAWETYAESVSA